jgi:putative hydrolase of the HAD superfamily
MNDPLPKAILLDLDNTILALSASADPCWQSVCERFAIQMEGVTPAELFEAIKEIRVWYWGDAKRHRRGRLNLSKARREIVAAALLRLNIDAPTLANEIADTFAREREAALQPMPGAIDALQRLRGRGVRLALITNGNAEGQRRKIERFELAERFDCIVIEGEFGVGKPDERIYRHALEALNVRPEETWMVGDNLEWDVSAPQRLGILGIWLDHAGQGLPETSQVRPDRTIRSLSELI